MSIIDPERLLERVEGDLEFLQETYALFCEESQIKQSNLRAAFEAADLEAVRSIAHSLKGMLSNFLAEQACETAGLIELIEGPSRLASAAPLLDKLSNQIDTMADEIRQILEDATS